MTSLTVVSRGAGGAAFAGAGCLDGFLSCPCEIEGLSMSAIPKKVKERAVRSPFLLNDLILVPPEVYYPA